MGNKAVIIPYIFLAVALFGAAFLFSPTPAAAAGRDSVARGIIDMVTERLCERQEALGGRIHLIHPSKCATTPPPPAEPTVTLTASPTTITAGQSTTLTWNSTSATSCTAFLGWTGAKATSGSTSVSPTQTTTYQLDCTGPGGVGSDDATVTVTVVNPSTPTVDISADPTAIVAGSSTMLTWNSENTTACTAANGWNGSKSLDGTQSVSPTVTTTYAISCTGAGGTANDSVTVTVSQPAAQPTLDFSADPTAISESGTSTLTWASANATSCTASDGWGGAKSLSGNQNVTPNATTTYTLTCTGAGGSIAKSVIVNVVPNAPQEPMPTLTFSASPSTVHENSASDATTTLTWDSTNATSCTASGASEWTGAKTADGSLTVTPTADVTYDLDCTGPGGTVNKEVVIDFVPVEVPAGIGHVVISEVYYDVASSTTAGSANDSQWEWVEIYNGSASVVNLQNWSIADASSTSPFDVITENVTLQPGAYAVISASTTPAGIPGGVAVIVLQSSIGSNGFANGNDAAILRNAAEAVVDQVGWGTNISVTPNTAAVGDGHSIARNQLTSDTDGAGDWSNMTTPTPGQ